mgnify:CR=1 FL=1|jgi:hypothetical protein|tara:strand:- start:737 stop:955 length:219 start_codon:yes stop_codon:yes gene_type:complete
MTDASTKLLMLRNIRNELLQESDWVVIKAQETSTSIPSAWTKYRQELRDITKTYKSMDDKGFAFPTKPTDTE